MMTIGSRGKRAAFALATVILSLALLAGVELVLSAIGWGGYPPVVRELASTENGRIMITDPDGALSYFFSNPEHPGNYVQHDFLMPKPPGTIRVFLFGGSAIREFPQPRNLTSSSFLEAIEAAEE